MKVFAIFLCLLFFTEKIQCEDQTLLIINYNHPYYESIDFIREIYSSNFPNIVFYGEKSHPEVNQISHHYGWFAQNVIADAMQRWPDYEGYLFLEDDCFMNFWNYGRLDKDKIWLHNNAPLYDLKEERAKWCWWNMPCGRPAMQKAYDQLPDSYKEMLAINLGANAVLGSVADMAYIPAAYRNDFIELSNYFSEVFIEIAIPTMFCCLEYRENWENLNFFWGCKTLPNDYDPALDWIHPIKFSKAENRQFISSILISRGYK